MVSRDELDRSLTTVQTMLKLDALPANFDTEVDRLRDLLDRLRGVVTIRHETHAELIARLDAEKAARG